MKKLILLYIILLFTNNVSAQFIFDYQQSSLNEDVLENEPYIKNHLLGIDIARKVKMLDLAYKWVDPPSAIRSASKIQIEKKIIYFSVKKLISPKYYKYKIKIGDISLQEARKEVNKIIDIALMIRYQDTGELEVYLRKKKIFEIKEIFLNQILIK